MASGKPAPSPSSAGLSFPTGPRGAAFSKSPPRPSAPLDPASRGAQAAGATPPTQSQPGDRPLQPGVRTQGPGAETRTSTSARQCGLPARGARPQRRHRAAGGARGARLSLRGTDSPPTARRGVGMEGGAHLGPETQDSARRVLRVHRGRAAPGAVRARPARC